MNPDAGLNEILELPQLESIFEALRRGKHLSPRDGELFHALRQHEPLYRRLFDRLGFDLVRHPRDFFYFHDRTNFTDLAARIGIFMFILVEHLADQGELVEETVMTRRFDYRELPHLQGERYPMYMREAGATTAEDLAAVVRTMERFGFARRLDAETFCFEAPIYRFLDLCMELAVQAPDGQAAEAEETAGEDAPR